MALPKVYIPEGGFIGQTINPSSNVTDFAATINANELINRSVFPTTTFCINKTEISLWVKPEIIDDPNDDWSFIYGAGEGWWINSDPGGGWSSLHVSDKDSCKFKLINPAYNGKILTYTWKRHALLNKPPYTVVSFSVAYKGINPVSTCYCPNKCVLETANIGQGKLRYLTDTFGNKHIIPGTDLRYTCATDYPSVSVNINTTAKIQKYLTSLPYCFGEPISVVWSHNKDYPYPNPHCIKLVIHNSPIKFRSITLDDNIARPFNTDFCLPTQ